MRSESASEYAHKQMHFSTEQKKTCVYFGKRVCNGNAIYTHTNTPTKMVPEQIIIFFCDGLIECIDRKIEFTHIRIYLVLGSRKYMEKSR